MVMAGKKSKQEKDFIGQILDAIGFRGLTREEEAGKDGLIKHLSERILRRTGSRNDGTSGPRQALRRGGQQRKQLKWIYREDSATGKPVCGY